MKTGKGLLSSSQQTFFCVGSGQSLSVVPANLPVGLIMQVKTEGSTCVGFFVRKNVSRFL